MSRSLDVKDFKILTALEARVDESLTQREIAAAADLSVGTVNRAMADLHERGFVREGMLSAAGLEALEPYRVKRAVLIAAGFGSRLVPITLNTPKPLIRVQGQRIIDSLLDAVFAAGIEEVYVVRGYLAEQFDQLLYSTPREVHREPFLQRGEQHLFGCGGEGSAAERYVFESDLLLYNPKLITKYQYSSNYLGVPVPVTDDWCFQTRRGVITGLTVGGTDCHHMFGISYWTEEDGRKLADDVPATFAMPGGKERYWDEVALRYFARNYEVSVRECTFDDVIEIDTYRELQQLDKSYVVG